MRFKGLSRKWTRISIQERPGITFSEEFYILQSLALQEHIVRSIAEILNKCKFKCIRVEGSNEHEIGVESVLDFAVYYGLTVDTITSKAGQLGEPHQAATWVISRTIWQPYPIDTPRG